MISDEPDEDADNLDDEKLLDALYDGDSPKQDTRADRAMVLPGWPPPRSPDRGLTLDPATLAWFKANHADWRAEIGVVLRGWTATHTFVQPSIARTELFSADNFSSPDTRRLG